jgi:hypothetical protein
LFLLIDRKNVQQAIEGARCIPVCNVPKTRCPVSAAVIASEIVSKSRISPTMITSGSAERAAQGRVEERVWYALRAA